MYFVHYASFVMLASGRRGRSRRTPAVPITGDGFLSNLSALSKPDAWQAWQAIDGPFRDYFVAILVPANHTPHQGLMIATSSPTPIQTSKFAALGRPRTSRLRRAQQLCDASGSHFASSSTSASSQSRFHLDDPGVFTDLLVKLGACVWIDQSSSGFQPISTVRTSSVVSTSWVQGRSACVLQTLGPEESRKRPSRLVETEGHSATTKFLSTHMTRGSWSQETTT